ncbi:MAG: hypothetical protein R6V59_04915 [Dehalococcoidia bacterium]
MGKTTAAIKGIATFADMPTEGLNHSGEGELIGCFHKQPPVLLGQSYHVARGEERKEMLKSPNLEAKIGAFQN